MGQAMGDDDDDVEFDDDPTETPIVPMMNTVAYAEAAAANFKPESAPKPEMASTGMETDPMPELEPPPPVPVPLPKPEVTVAVVQTDKEPTPPPTPM